MVSDSFGVFASFEAKIIIVRKSLKIDLFSVFVIFVFPEKPFIDMEEPWTKVWEVNVGEPSTYIPVKYSAYPEPIIKWCVHSNICFMHSSFHALKLQFQNWMDFVTLLLLCVPRFKNDLPLNDYRIKQKSDALVIREVKETDAGIYTVILTNKITKEEQRRSFQLLVNGVFFFLFFSFYIHFQLPVVDMTLLLPLQFLLVS